MDFVQFKTLTKLKTLKLNLKNNNFTETDCNTFKDDLVKTLANTTSTITCESSALSMAVVALIAALALLL